MNILLLYPKRVESLYQRETRLDHQLECIATLTRRLLADADIEQNFTVREIAYKPNPVIGRDAPASEMHGKVTLQEFSLPDLLNLYDNSDLVIEISGDKHTQAEIYEYEGSSITLRPTYPGSFSQNDINIECRNIDEKSWMTERVIEASRIAEQSARVAEYVEPDMHYSQFSPLPYRLGKDFYSRPRLHGLVFLSYSAGENTDEVSDLDQEMITTLLHDMEGLAAITLITDTLTTHPRAEFIATAMKDALGITTTVFSQRRGDYRDLFSVLSKCDLALFAGSSLYIDAIRLGKPAYIWRSKQAGIEPINEAFCTLQEEYDPHTVVQEQRHHLDRLIESHYLGHTLTNDKRILLEALSAIITRIAPGIVVNTDELISNPTVPEPVISQPRIWHEDSLRKRIRHRVSNGRRKLTKFKQSPDRFFADSDNRIARKLYTFIR